MHPESWLKDGLHLMWPESIPAKDYGRVIELMFRMGDLVRSVPKRRTNGVSHEVQLLAAAPINGTAHNGKKQRYRRRGPDVQNELRALMTELGTFSVGDIKRKTDAKDGSIRWAMDALKAKKDGKRPTPKGRHEQLWKVSAP